ncbi:CatA-like O-acetyltransferase [Bacteroides sp. CR5/BHMF/2]|nr:CatA-like O-acetyltransferase [Bacteroides sp. CR5/BHMF/2]
MKHIIDIETWERTGKAITKEGKLVMPIAMTIHHGFIDGHHLSLFYRKVEELLK